MSAISAPKQGGLGKLNACRHIYEVSVVAQLLWTRHAWPTSAVQVRRHSHSNPTAVNILVWALAPLIRRQDGQLEDQMWHNITNTWL